LYISLGDIYFKKFPLLFISQMGKMGEEREGGAENKRK
jgi:hypothetical protein